MRTAPTLKLGRPKVAVQRVYITARDPETGESKSLTVYGVSPEQVIDVLRSLAEPESGEPAPSVGAAQSAPSDG